MIIFLDQSLADEIESNGSFDSDEAIAIDIAAEAYRRGNHILTSDIRTLDRLIASSHALHERTRMILNKVRSKVPTRGHLLSRIKWRLRLIAKGNNPEKLVTSDDSTEIQIPAKIASDKPTLLDSASLITENIDDAKFYRLLVRSAIESDSDLHRSFAGIEIRAKNVAGGGHTIWQSYKMEIDNGDGFCLAIIDSDKRHPGSSFGETAKELCSLEEPPNTPAWNCAKLVLNVRSVENLIPVSEFLNACHNIDKRQFDLANQLIAQHWGKEQWKYLPIKRGIKCHDLFKKNTNAALYWRAVLGAKRCSNFSMVECQNRESCETYAIEPISTSLLQRVSSKDHSLLAIHPAFDAHIFDETKRLAEAMIAQFCAERKTFDRDSMVTAKLM